MAITVPPRSSVPGIDVLRAYQPAWLPSDIVAGLVLTAVLVPVGMGYAGGGRAAGDHRPVRDDRPAAHLCRARPEPDPRPRAGLVAGGDHRRDGHPAGGRRPGRAVALAGGLALISGAFGVAFGVLHLGLLTGPALEADPDRLPQRHRPDRHRLPAAEAVRLLDRRGRPDRRDGRLRQGVAGGDEPRRARDRRLALAIMVVARLRVGRAVGIVVATVVTTVVTAVTGPARKPGSTSSAPLPQGLPRLAMPAVGIGDLAAMLAGGVAIAVVSLADTSVLSRTFALRERAARSTRTRSWSRSAPPTSGRPSRRASR